MEEALEILFGDSTSLEKPIDEIQWIESYQLKGGFPRIRSYLQHPDRAVRTAAFRALTGLKPNMLIPELTELLSPYLDIRKVLSVGEVAEISHPQGPRSVRGRL